MATTRPTLASLAKQVERLCLEAGCCPTHPRENLWCATCQLSWEGTEAEWQELIALAARLPYHRAGGPTSYRCPRCREALWCDSCFRAEMTRLPSREVTMPLSDEELARYQKLSVYLTLREHSDGLPPIRLHWGDPTPTEATETDSPTDGRVDTNSRVTPAPEIEPEPEVVPELADDPDDELAATVQQLVDEVRRRLRS
jgi:hypothetical protein